MSIKYKHLLIDLDNTIWDFDTNSKNSLEEVFHLHKLHTSFDGFEHFHNLYVLRNHQLWADYANKQINKKTLNYERFNYPLQQVGIFNPEWAETIGKDYLQRVATQTELMPHARELLEYLKGKYQMHILSNGFAEIQYTKLKCSDLEQYFDKVFLSEIVGVLKPDKRIFEYAVKSLNARKNEVLMIGDNFEADIVGAHKAGLDQVFYNINKDTNLSFMPTYTVFSLDEIAAIL